MIRDWEERLNARQVVAQIQADMFDEHGLSCPNCRQFNAKVSVRLVRYVEDIRYLRCIFKY